jgi:NTE family protein
MRKPKSDQKIGLALGGGAVFGAAHVGVLRALAEREIPISAVSGTSIGAFVAALYAFGKSWEEIREIALELRWLDVSGMSLSRYALLSNRKLGEMVIDAIGNVDIDEARIPLAVTATDIASGDRVVLLEGGVADAVMASASIPGIFIPVEIGDRLLVDGGVVENVPLSPLSQLGADFFIGVDLNAKKVHQRPTNIIDVLLNSLDFAMRNATRTQTAGADIRIEPDLSEFNKLDAGQTADLIERGYSEATRILAEL